MLFGELWPSGNSDSDNKISEELSLSRISSHTLSAFKGFNASTLPRTVLAPFDAHGYPANPKSVDFGISNAIKALA